MSQAKGKNPTKKPVPRPLGRGVTLFLAYWIFFALGLADSSIAPSLPTFARNMNVPLGSLGILFTARALGFLTIFVIAGWLTARFGRGRLMVIALAMAVLAQTTLPVIEFLPLQILMIVIYGFGAGASSVSANALVGDLSPQERSVAMNRLYVFISVGGFIGPMIIGVALSLWGSVGPPFWIAAFMMLIALVPLAWIPLPKMPPAIRRIGSVSLRRDRRFWLLAVFLFVFVGLDAGFNAWIFSYVRTSLGGEVAVASAASSAFWIASMSGRLARIGPFRRVPDGPLIIISCTSAFLAIGLLIFVRAPLFAVVASVWLGISLSTLYPTALGLGQQLRPEEPVAVISLMGIASAAGSLTLPWFYGQFLAGQGQAWPIALLINLILVLVLAVGVSVFIASETEKPVLLSEKLPRATTPPKKAKE